MRKAPVYKRRIIAASLLLSAVMLFNVFGYYYIDSKTAKNHQREDGEKLLSAQESRAEEIAQTIIVLGIHNTSFSRQQTSRQLQELTLNLEAFTKENENLTRIVDNNEWFYAVRAKEIFGQTVFFSSALLRQARSILNDTARSFANNYAFSGEVRKTASHLQRSYRDLNQAFNGEEGILEKEIDTMNKALILSLLAALFFIGIIITAPSLKSNKENFLELQKTLEDVKNSESLLRTVIDSSPDLIYIMDHKLTYKMVNKAFSRLANIPQESFINRSNADLDAPSSGERIAILEETGAWAECNRAVISTGQPSYMAEASIPVDGKTLSLSITRLPLRDSEGQVWGMLGFAHDITERIEWEKKIQASERQYRYLFESNPMPMWIFDIETLKFLKVNQMAIEHYGYSSEEFACMTILDIRPEKQIPQLKTHIASYNHEQGNHMRGQWTHLKKNGEEIIMEIFSHQIEYSNRKAMLVLAKDVTDAIRLQAALVDERVNRQRDIAQATIDVQEKERNEIGKELHDNVNQILTSAKLHLEYMDSDLAQKEKHQATGISLIATAINEIRRLSKTLVPPTIKDIGLISSVQELTDSINYLKSVQFHFFHDDIDEDALSEGLKLTIFRIIQEQTTNILKYASASSASVTIRQNKQRLQLSVSDNGKGFDTARQSKGVGIINIVNRADIYGGTVLIESAPGEGCSLSVDFDLAKLQNKSSVPFS